MGAAEAIYKYCSAGRSEKEYCAQQNDKEGRSRYHGGYNTRVRMTILSNCGVSFILVFLQNMRRVEWDESSIIGRRIRNEIIRRITV